MPDSPDPSPALTSREENALVDLVVQYEALRPHRLVYAAPDYEHGRVFSLVLRKYWDFLPYLEVQRAAYKQRLERG